MSISMVRREEIILNFKDGFAQTELLPGTFEGITNYRCELKAGCTVQPKLYSDKVVVYCFTKGGGYITDGLKAYNITELSFYTPDFDKNELSIHAVSDMEFLCLVSDMTEGDWRTYEQGHHVLPIFAPISQCREYTQDCKGPNTQSWSVLSTRNIGRIMVGVVRAVGEGTTEKGHPSVDQWNYCLDGADFNLTVDGETVSHKDGDWSFVPAGLDHSLVAEPGKLVYYIWFEHFVKEFGQ